MVFLLTPRSEAQKNFPITLRYTTKFVYFEGILDGICRKRKEIPKCEYDRCFREGERVHCNVCKREKNGTGVVKRETGG